MSVELSPDDVKRVALLSRIAVTPDEVAMFQTSLSSILGYVSILEQVPTEGVEPMAHAIEMTNCFREDEVDESLSVKEALKNAPLTDGTYFLVPAVMAGQAGSQA